MNPLSLLWTDLRILVVDTVKVWWRLFPQIAGIYLLGWLGFQVALKIAAYTEDLNVWVTIAVFSAGFLTQLIPIVLILRLVGRELGIREMVPEEDNAQDERDNSITHLLAVTLLPFIGIYAAFGQLNDAANELWVNQMVRTGAFSSDNVLAALSNIAKDQPVLLIGVVIGSYVVRRVIDLLHERTGWRVLGIGVALIESFFMMVVVLGGVRLFQTITGWFMDRAVVGWFASGLDAFRGLLASLNLRLPELVDQWVTFYLDEVWPSFWEVFSQPIIWLAVAALVYGSHVMSVAELWRKRTPITTRLKGATSFEPRSDRRRLQGIKPPPAGVQRAAVEFKEALLGDIDDKYLPTINSVRLILRAGVIFLGAYIAVYAVHQILNNYAHVLVQSIVGGHDITFWVTWGPVWDLLYGLPFEPLRLCLLAVAFRRCLELFRARAHPTDQVVTPAAPEKVAA
ncbi:hypothetical protein [Microlunatus speluncae]|uniref:hypothetical protein n=1 Tax=Microlunatus speluncae TaxID=2594267 RepID=UPI0012665A15|nr:hypothetical protein [Microlunatus speluncae]